MARTFKSIQVGVEAVYARTLNNCEFYIANGDREGFLREIEALRGVAYALEEICGNSCVWSRPEWTRLSGIKEAFKEVQ